MQHAGKGARRLTKRPGLLSDLHAHQERFGEHEREEEHVEPGTESIKEPGVRERSRSAFIGLMTSGNRARRDPAEGRETPRVETR